MRGRPPIRPTDSNESNAFCCINTSAFDDLKIAEIVGLLGTWQDVLLRRRLAILRPRELRGGEYRAALAGWIPCSGVPS